MTAAPEQALAFKAVGGYPISDSTSSLWLDAANGRPLLMVFFSGPKDWYEIQWNIDFKFEDGHPGWAQLRSEHLTLRLDVYPETWEVAILGSKFSVRQSNTFLVLHTGELLVQPKVIPLGIFDLPASTDNPASVRLLRAHLELAERIEQEARAGIRASQIDRSHYRYLTPPCRSLGTGLLFPPVIRREKLLPSTYSLPCSANPTYLQ